MEILILNRDEILHKEIDLIQGCINRMAHNSFLLKGWAVTLISAILLLFIRENDAVKSSVIFLIFLVFVFWCLDAYFLSLEKSYRRMYKVVVEKRLSGNMEFLYNLNPEKFRAKYEPMSSFFSLTLILFYFGIILFIFFLHYYGV